MLLGQQVSRQLYCIGIHSRVNVQAAPLTKVKQREGPPAVQCIYLDVFIWGPAVSSVLSFLRILSSPVPFNCNHLMDSFALPVKTVIAGLTVMLSVFHRGDESCH